ncbi:ComEC/Rec2 family competence protein [Mucilaginibacter segetis]|uniref:ComEC family competence protein n=1 Tax=Mucilaginibacter segetis TaxID=2793071 RepID=A0A934PQX1_9SPHI|nr:ComEC/Rec2 family competence protein [Mucilaginibacter segetis]MBK0379114.1 ComEC family competence protein [Mucilaginibacter segetis]
MRADHKGELPALFLIFPFIAGISVGLKYPTANAPFILVPLLTLCFLFILFNWGYNKFNIYKKRWLGGLLITPILLLSGWLIVLQHYQLNHPDHFSKTSSEYLVTTINNEPVQKNGLTRFIAEVKQIGYAKKASPATGKILVTIKDSAAKILCYGDELLIPAKYDEVSPPLNPGEFNYKQYLAHKNIYHQLFLYPGQYKVVDTNCGNPVIAYALQLRQNLVTKLKRNMHDTTAITVASTLILGYKADLSNDILQAYSKTGTIHILSVSGGHVAIIYLLLSWLLSFLNGNKRGRVFKAILIIMFIWGYALLTGFSPAVTRAALMISFIITGKTYSRYINTLNILAFSAFILLLGDPFLLTDVGFQLSYLAVTGLILLQPIIYKWISFKNKWTNKLWLICSVSIAAQAVTFPLSAYYFHQFPVYFLLSNVLIVLPVSIIMYTGILLLLLPQITFVSNWLGYILEKTILAMNSMLHLVENAPAASINKIWLTSTEYILLYIIMVSFFAFCYKKSKWKLVVLLFSVLVLAFSVGVKNISGQQIRSVTFLSLRKHQGIVFKNGNEGVVLTDLPETDKSFQYSIQPCLDSSRIYNYKIYTFSDNIRTKYLAKQNDLIQFLNKKMFLLNSGGKSQSIPQSLKPHYIYLAKNSIIDPENIEEKSIFIIDGTNNNSHIDSLISLFGHKRINYKLLSRNKSATFLSN